VAQLFDNGGKAAKAFAKINGVAVQVYHPLFRLIYGLENTASIGASLLMKWGE